MPCPRVSSLPKRNPKPPFPAFGGLFGVEWGRGAWFLRFPKRPELSSWKLTGGKGNQLSLLNPRGSNLPPGFLRVPSPYLPKNKRGKRASEKSYTQGDKGGKGNVFAAGKRTSVRARGVGGLLYLWRRRRKICPSPFFGGEDGGEKGWSEFTTGESCFDSSLASGTVN